MKVAVLAPITWRTPPRNYGPWEQVASVMTEELIKLGVDVTLFATGDSITKAKLKSVCDSPLGEVPGDSKVNECLHISELMETADSYDLIHNHFDFLPLTYSRLIKQPMITTIHGFSNELIVPVYKKYNSDNHYVSISDANRHADLSYLDTVYNGIDESVFDLGTGSGDYLLYFGRIHPEKGASEAIQIALGCNKKLLLCGLIQDHAYYEELVHPYLNNTSICYAGNVDPEARNNLMGNALALLHPISFEEPFGLSVVESMICGTPVIAFNRGSMRELIIDKRTGFLVNNIDEAINAVNELSDIERADCRRHAIQHFTGTVMATKYLDLYKQILS